MEIYTYNGLFFTIYDNGRIIIEGSLHRYWNQGKQNFNDYSFNDLCLTLQDLSEKFTSTILEGEVQNIECGINFILPFPVRDYLDTVITLKGTSPSRKHSIVKDDLKGFEKGYHFKKSHYGLKIYDKGKQYNRLESIVRHEFKTFRMQIIENIGIKYLSDLKDKQKIADLSKKLLEIYSSVLIAEKLPLNTLSRAQERIYLECSNDSNWGSWNRAKRAKKLKQFNQILYKHASTDIKSIVTSLLIEMREKLLV